MPIPPPKSGGRGGRGGCLQIQISIVIQSSNPLLGKKIYLWTSERIFSFPVRLLEYIRANKAPPWDGVPIVLGKRASHPFRSRGKSSSSANRMYSGFSNIPMILGLIWSIRSRPVCHSVDHSAPSIRVPMPCPNNDRSQHPVPRLEQVGQDLSFSYFHNVPRSGRDFSVLQGAKES